MHEVSGWISLGAELGDGEEKEGEVIPQVSTVPGVTSWFTLRYFNRPLWMSAEGISVADFADVMPMLGSSPSIPSKQIQAHHST